MTKVNIDHMLFYPGQNGYSIQNHTIPDNVKQWLDDQNLVLGKDYGIDMYTLIHRGSGWIEFVDDSIAMLFKLTWSGK